MNEKQKIAIRLGKALLIGLGFGFLSFLLSGDGGSSLALGLLIAYLEYKFAKDSKLTFK